jgi:hypothetical protein
MKNVDIDALLNDPSGTITIKGTTHVVEQLGEESYRYLNTATAAEATDRLFEIARRCAPTIPADVQLTIRAANKIIAIASGDIEAVEKLAPNAESPARSS